MPTALNSNQVNALLDAKGPGAAIYLVGAGGCGMSGLGHLLLDLGYRVAGSDLAVNTEVLQLLARGAVIHTGHLGQQFKAARPVLLVYSSAIRMDNPEVIAAEQAEVPIVQRGVALAALLSRQRGIAVAGMHGKTTTSALLAYALQQLQAKPSYAVGALVQQLAPHAKFNPNYSSSSSGALPYFVAEADESDGTLQEFEPEHAILLNIDAEHLDHYRDLEAIKTEFQIFAGKTAGKTVFCADDPNLNSLCAGNPRAISYGFAATADYRVKQKSGLVSSAMDISSGAAFAVWKGEERLGEFVIRLFGAKNISNAAAVVALLHQLNFQPCEIAFAIRSFRGAARRQEEIYRDSFFRVFDDYGHHPSEIRATLAALRDLSPGRLLVAFQPHRFTRTQALMDEFTSSFSGADLLWLTEIYAASEPPIAGVTSEALAGAMREHGQPVAYVRSLDGLCARVREAMQPGDTVLFLGAGDITKAAHQLVRELQKDCAARKEALSKILAGRLAPGTILRIDEMLAKKTTLRVGGRADLYVEPASESDLAEALKFCAEERLPFMILGRGSNLLIRDGGIRGVVICLSNPHFCRIEIRVGELHCGAGAKLRAVAVEAKRHGLSGLEFLEGIPGTVGGALRMNAGAMGGWMFRAVKSIRFMDSTGAAHEKLVAEIDVEYRNCPLLKENIALGAVLQGEPAAPEKIAETMNVCSQKRWRSQPAAPSAGCIFKNPLTVPAGKLIDELGLKGTRVGGAIVSDVHGNFIVNEGSATAQDVLNLIEIIKQKARVARGIELETEVEVVGENASYRGCL